MTTYKANYHAVQRFLVSDDARDLIRPHARDVAARAQQLIPRGNDDNTDHVHTADTVQVEDGPVVVSRSSSRVSVRVTAAGAIVPLEFGNKRTRARQPLRRAISA